MTRLRLDMTQGPELALPPSFSEAETKRWSTRCCAVRRLPSLDWKRAACPLCRSKCERILVWWSASTPCTSAYVNWCPLFAVQASVWQGEGG